MKNTILRQKFASALVMAALGFSVFALAASPAVAPPAVAQETHGSGGSSTSGGDAGDGYHNGSSTSIPEPTSLTLLGSGLAGLYLLSRRRKNR